MRGLVTATAVLLVAAACSSSGGGEVALLTNAVPVGPEALTTDELGNVADLRQGDELYRAPLGAASVLIRVRTGHEPLVFGTSCAVVSGFHLPDGWDAVCLELTAGGQRHHGRFPFGVGGPGQIAAGARSIGAYTDPGERALMAAVAGHPDLVDPVVAGLVLLFADERIIDTRVRIEGAGFCHWYGSGGLVGPGGVSWSANEALPCEE